MNSEVITGLVAIVELLGLIGAGYALVRARARANELERDLVRAEERARALEAAQASNAQLLKAQAAETASAVAEQLVVRASETFRSQEQLAQAKLEAQLKPVAETLAKFEAQVQAIEKSRAEDTGGLKTQIEALLKASDATQWVALGLGYPHAEMDRLWAEIIARAPHHYEAHFSALQYWCAK